MITAQSQTPPYRVSFTDGEHEAIADAAVESGGGNRSFSPHAYLEAALATCVTMTVRMYADRRNIPLTNVQTTVRLDKGASEESVFEYEVLLEGDLTPEQREKLAYIATACPVRRSLAKPIRLCRFFSWAIEHAGTRPAVKGLQAAQAHLFNAMVGAFAQNE